MKSNMKTKIEEFEVLIPSLDGMEIAERVKVPVTLEWDEEVKEWLLTPEAHEAIDNTKARLIGLLLPAQMKELRERCDCTQKEMGELFQVGEKSWTRWESGKHRASRSINLLIRALYEGEISINYLLKRAGKPPREEAQVKLEEKEPNWMQPGYPPQEILYSVNRQVAYKSKGHGKICFSDAIQNLGNLQTAFPDDKGADVQGAVAHKNAPGCDLDKLNLKSA